MLTQNVTVYVGWGHMAGAKARHGVKGKDAKTHHATSVHECKAARGRKVFRVLPQDRQADRWLEVEDDEHTGEETWREDGHLSTRACAGRLKNGIRPSASPRDAGSRMRGELVG